VAATERLTLQRFASSGTGGGESLNGKAPALTWDPSAGYSTNGIAASANHPVG
jgi:hypothetical protein